MKNKNVARKLAAAALVGIIAAGTLTACETANTKGGSKCGAGHKCKGGASCKGNSSCKGGASCKGS